MEVKAGSYITQTVESRENAGMFSAPLASSVLHGLGPQTGVAHFQAVSFASVKAIRQPPTDTLQATLTWTIPH